MASSSDYRGVWYVTASSGVLLEWWRLFDGGPFGRLMLVGVVASLVMWLSASALHRMTSRSVMLSPGLYGVTGRMGRGKSYFLALVAYWARRGGRQVWANYPLEGAHRYSNWSEVLGVPDGSVVLMDEVQLWWASSDHAAPTEVRQWVTQLRKRKLTVIWASQDFEFVARWLRKLSFGIWECSRTGRGHVYTLVDPSQAGRSKRYQKSLSKLVVPRRRKVMRTYDTYALVEASREWGSVEASG